MREPDIKIKRPFSKPIASLSRVELKAQVVTGKADESFEERTRTGEEEEESNLDKLKTFKEMKFESAPKENKKGKEEERK